MPALTPVIGRLPPNKNYSRLTFNNDGKDSDSSQGDHSEPPAQFNSPTLPTFDLNKPGDNKDLNGVISKPVILPEEFMLKIDPNSATVTLSGDQIQAPVPLENTRNSIVN